MKMDNDGITMVVIFPEWHSNSQCHLREDKCSCFMVVGLADTD